MGGVVGAIGGAIGGLVGGGGGIGGVLSGAGKLLGAVGGLTGGGGGSGGGASDAAAQKAALEFLDQLPPLPPTVPVSPPDPVAVVAPPPPSILEVPEFNLPELVDVANLIGTFINPLERRTHRGLVMKSPSSLGQVLTMLKNQQRRRVRDSVFFRDFLPIVDERMRRSGIRVRQSSPAKTVTSTLSGL